MERIPAHYVYNLNGCEKEGQRGREKGEERKKITTHFVRGVRE